jgi:CyaY protein
MDNKQFQQLSEQVMHNVEQFIDQDMMQNDSDIDYEIHGNVMTITLENRHKIIINKQEPLHQIWMATRRQGYHFNYQQSHWYCDRSGQEFFTILKNALVDLA